MAETTINNVEIPNETQTLISKKLEELKYINNHLAQNREEIDWLQTETGKTLGRVKILIGEMRNDKANR